MPLGLFRILFGACLSMDIAGLIHDAAFWFDHVPFEVSAGPWPRVTLWAWLAAALSLTLGYRTRIAALLNYGFCVLVLGFGGMRYGYEYHPDGLYLLTSLGLMFLPVSARLSLDAKAVGARPVNAVPFTFLACVAAGIYLDSAIWKLSSELWVNGLGYWLPAVQSTDAFVSIPWTFETRWLAQLLSHVTLAYELLFPVLIWFRRLRWPLLAIGFGLHLGVATVIPLPFFGLLMCAILVGLIPPPTEPATAHGPAAPNRSRAPMSLSGPVARPLAIATVGGILALYLMCLAEPIAVLKSRGIGAGLAPGTSSWPPKLPPLLARTHQRALVWSYRLFGIRSHPIFLDSAFKDYTVDRRLVFVPGMPSDTGAPTEDTLGAHPPHRNRHYVSWHYRTIWPLLDRPSMEVKLRRFVRLYAARAALDLTHGELRLQRRPVHLPVDSWRPNQRAQNQAQPWEDEAAFVVDDNGYLHASWLTGEGTATVRQAEETPGRGLGRSLNAGSPQPPAAATGTRGTKH